MDFHSLEQKDETPPNHRRLHVACDAWCDSFLCVDDMSLKFSLFVCLFIGHRWIAGAMTRRQNKTMDIMCLCHRCKRIMFMPVGMNVKQEIKNESSQDKV